MKKIEITATGNTASFIFEGGKRFFHFEGDFASNTVKLQYSFGGTEWSDANSDVGIFEATSNDGAWIDLPRVAMRASVTGGTAPALTLRIVDNYDKTLCI